MSSILFLIVKLLFVAVKGNNLFLTALQYTSHNLVDFVERLEKDLLTSPQQSSILDVESLSAS